MIRITASPVSIQCNVLLKQVSLTEIHIENFGTSIFGKKLITMIINIKDTKFIYSKTCIKRSPLEQRKSGLIRQVTS